MPVAVVVTHGMGTQTVGFSEGLRARVLDRLAERGVDRDGVVWHPILWSDVVEPREEAYLGAARRSAPLGSFFGLREFVVSALGDAAAYQISAGRTTSTYGLIHERIRTEMRILFRERLGEEPAPTVVAAHSLGGHIMSNYIWDCQRAHPTGAGDDAAGFERFAWLAGIVTFGCNIPLFTFAFSPVEPIDFPGRGLPEELAERATWRNCFDRHDVLGYPLKPLGERYAAVVEADVEMNVGGFPASLTPLAHNRYWGDDGFARELADVVARFIE